MGGKGGSGGSAPYQDELSGMFAAQNMMNLAARNPNAATLFRPGSKLGDSYKDLFGTNNLPAQQHFQIPDLGISTLAQDRVYGSNRPDRIAPPQQGGGKGGGQGQNDQPWGLTRPPAIPPQSPGQSADATQAGRRVYTGKFTG